LFNQPPIAFPIWIWSTFKEPGDVVPSPPAARSSWDQSGSKPACHGDLDFLTALGSAYKIRSILT
jgi:hypothetical protein